jgi:hypothetical protein
MARGWIRSWLAFVSDERPEMPLRTRASSAVVSHISRKTSEMPRISCMLHRTRPRMRIPLRKGA